jgi:hypothetical protein
MTELHRNASFKVQEVRGAARVVNAAKPDDKAAKPDDKK